MNEDENALSGQHKTGQAKLVRKLEAAIARRRQSINRTLSRRGFEVIGEDVYARSGGKIELTATLRSQLENYLLRRVGRSGALAKRVGDYCMAEHLHLVSVIEEFDTPEDRKLREAFEASRHVPTPKESPIKVPHR